MVIRKLVQNKVSYVFGYPGGAMLPVLDAIRRESELKFVLTKTEIGASFMAEGYAKAHCSRRPGAVLVTSGPGATNIITSLQNAYMDGTPLIAMCGQVSTTEIGTDAFQEADIFGMTNSCTKWNTMVKDTSCIESTIQNAFDICLRGRPGPVLVDLPKNIMASKIQEQLGNGTSDVMTSKMNWHNTNDQRKRNPSLMTTNNRQEDNLNKVFETIMNAKKPVIIAGQGVITAQSVDLLRRYSQLAGIPVTTTLLALGCEDEDNKRSLQMLGMYGSYVANYAVQNADVVICIGSRFDDRIIGKRESFARNARRNKGIIHIDTTMKNINKTIKTEKYINSDAKDALQALLQNTYTNFYKERQAWVDHLDEVRREYPYAEVYRTRRAVLKCVNFKYSAKNVIAILNAVLLERLEATSLSTYIVADVGAHQMWAAQAIQYDYPKVQMITSGGLGAMGFAIPASIGVKLAKPKAGVVCVVGDGGFSMSMNELLTAVESKINIKVLLINNNYQLMVKMWQDLFYSNGVFATEMKNPDFGKVARAFGAKAISINPNDTPDVIFFKLKYFLEWEDGPIVCNVTTMPDEYVYPMVRPGQPIDDMIMK